MPYVGVKPAAITSATEAEIAGDLTVDTTTLVVEATNNNVGVNTTAVAADLEVGASASKINVLTVKTATGSGGVAGISFIAGQITAGRETAAMFFKETNGGAHYTGDLVFAIATSSGSAAQVAASDEVCRITSNGLTFNGDTAAANALDDYEEGDASSISIATGSATFTKQRYTKIGNMVNVRFNVTSISDQSTANNIVIQNLPFTSAANTQSVGTVLGRYTTAGDGPVIAFIGGSDSELVFFGMNDGGNYDQIEHQQLNNAAAQFVVNITYETA